MDATLITEPEITRTLHLRLCPAPQDSKPFLAVRTAIRGIVAELAKDEAIGWRAPEKV